MGRRGVRGITSNPTIFQKAIESPADYDEQFGELDRRRRRRSRTRTGTSSRATSATALRILRPVYDESDGVDGYVSVEVAPSLARDTDGHHRERPRCCTRPIDEPNLYVKIPGTAEGLPAIQQMIAEGRSINVTLLFGLERYGEVIEAYLAGLEALRRRPVAACRRWRRSS